MSAYSHKRFFCIFCFKALDSEHKDLSLRTFVQCSSCELLYHEKCWHLAKGCFKCKGRLGRPIIVSRPSIEEQIILPRNAQEISVTNELTIFDSINQVAFRPGIFVSYARQDKAKIEDVYTMLMSAGCQPWVDRKDILPGEKWEPLIKKAIRESDFFLACLTTNSVNKRGMIQKEIKEALEVWREKIESDIYLIPVRLENCDVPDELHDFQWVDLFEAEGWDKLIKAIQVGMERRNK